MSYVIFTYILICLEAYCKVCIMPIFDRYVQYTSPKHIAHSCMTKLYKYLAMNLTLNIYFVYVTFFV